LVSPSLRLKGFEEGTRADNKRTKGQPSFISYFGLATRSNASALIGSLNGVFQAGGVIGTLLLPLIADIYGRKAACIVVCVV
jgi:MFS family permease